MIEWLSKPAVFDNLDKIMIMFSCGLVTGFFVAQAAHVVIRGLLVRVFKGRKK